MDDSERGRAGGSSDDVEAEADDAAEAGAPPVGPLEINLRALPWEGSQHVGGQQTASAFPAGGGSVPRLTYGGARRSRTVSSSQSSGRASIPPYAPDTTDAPPGSGPWHSADRPVMQLPGSITLFVAPGSREASVAPSPLRTPVNDAATEVRVVQARGQRVSAVR